ncbi:VOC family protein [Gordonia hydrophobica]|uniref:VOC family protein n=1 Tax=Gordonia hydrophobica TaxID=40516 RepID=A0ABZ2U172_9ACTN|nr:VOC family protein [Gordonia hydrophobica]MBM7368523.1 PhnB protein [Gordonia hydrophobica]
MASHSFSPYVSFPGNAAEAFTFYHEVFGGSLDLQKYGDTDTTGFPFTPPPDAVAHAQLSGGLITLAGGDGFGDDQHLTSDVYSFLIGLESVAEAESLIAVLTGRGSEIAMPFALAPWGDHYGQVRDPFGVLWALVVSTEE